MDNNDKNPEMKNSVSADNNEGKLKQDFKPSMFLAENNDWAGHLKFLDVNIEKIKNFFKMSEKEKNDTNNHLCIDGSWGTGKSVFAENIAFKWGKSSNKDNNSNKIVKINLWEYEMLPWPEDKVLLDILFNIFNEKTFNNIFEKIKIWFKQSQKSFSLNSNLNIFGTTILNFSFELQTNQKTKENKNHTNLIDEIKKETSHNNYLFILDELERCSPDYQLKFLNLIKNLLFKLTGVFFLIPCNCSAINEIALNYLKITNINEPLEMYTDKIFYQTFNIESITSLNFSKIDKVRMGRFLEDNFNPNLRLFHKIFDNEKIYDSIFNKNIKSTKKGSLEYDFILWPFFSFYMYYLKYSYPKIYNEFTSLFINNRITLNPLRDHILFFHLGRKTNIDNTFYNKYLYKNGFYMKPFEISCDKIKEKEHWTYYPKLSFGNLNPTSDFPIIDSTKKIYSVQVNDNQTVKSWLGALSQTHQSFTFSDHFKKLHLLMVQYLQNNPEIPKINLIVTDWEINDDSIKIAAVAPVKEIENFITTELMFY